MKIAVIGYSGSGKSTLASRLAEYFGCEKLHLDMIHFSSGWIERSDEEMVRTVSDFMKKDNWVIEGNYSNILYTKRMEEADHIIILAFNRFCCLWRAFKRYWQYKGNVRPDVAAGCYEKFDLEFIRWILWEGRSKSIKQRYQRIAEKYPQKVIVLKNQAQLDNYLNEIIKRK